ncbi:MAG: signal peptidase I [Oligoflexus sp.]
MSDKKKVGFWSPENLKSLFILIVIIMCFRWSVASPYHVPTASMEPTIKVGDRLLAFKLSYDLKLPFTDYSLIRWGKPERGDIIVFRFPKDPQIDYVKRVVGIAGDRIKVIDDILYINGEPQERVEFEHDRSILSDINDNPKGKALYKERLDDTEHWVIQDRTRFRFRPDGERYPADGEFVVPEDSLFVMGDNRDNSTDSRAWGVVPLSYVRGKAQFVIWSMYRGDDDSFLPSLRFNRFGYRLI